MKINKFYFFAALFIFLTACNNDDTTPSDEGVIGKWNVTAIDYSGMSASVVNGQSASATFTGTGVDMDLEIEFIEDPMNYTTSGDYGVDLVVNLMGQTFNIPFTNQGFIDAGTWSQSGNTLIVIDGMGNESMATIISLIDDVMILGYNFNMSQVENGATVSYDINGTYTFERQ